MNNQRFLKKLTLLAAGAITFGWLQGFQLLNFSDIFTSFFSLLLSVIVTALLGGDTSALTA